jgi:NADH dehydrogenase
VVSEQAEAEGRTLAGLGIEAQSMATILPSYLWRFRASGQFQRRQTA